MYVWSYGLAEFLRHSNEDVICSTFIGKLISRAVRSIWPECTGFVRIADIGCGPGSKAVKIAKRLRDDGVKTHWDLVDIDERWIDSVTENVRRVGNKNDTHFDVHCPLSAKSWMKSLAAVPHVAQFIQVPYDDETEEIVYSLTTELAEKRSVVLISTEHPHSDLNLIRKKFTKLGYRNLPSGRATSLAERFRGRGLDVKKYTLDKQYLDIGAAGRNENAEWLWDLIFGTKYSVKDEPNLAAIINEFCTRGFVPSLNTSLLSVPDLLLVVRQRA